MSFIAVSLLSAWRFSWELEVRPRKVATPTQQTLERADLAKQIVPVVFDPVFRELFGP
jgi:hypothetical protein